MTTPRALRLPKGGTTHRSRRVARVLAVLAIFGPGLISANAGNDAGGILTYASAGSQFGYRTLFLMVLITVALIVVQEMCSRLGVYTRRGPRRADPGAVPVRSSGGAMVLLFIANAGLTVSEFAGVGAAMEIFGVSQYIAVPIAAVAMWALTVLGAYSRAERVFLVMGLVFLAYPIAAFLGHPNGGGPAATCCGRTSSRSNAFLLLAVALIGTTITPYMQFYVASAVVDKGRHGPPTTEASESTRSTAPSGATWSASSSSLPPRPRSAGAVRCSPRRRRPGVASCGGSGRRTALRLRAAWCVTARGFGCSALDRLRDRRDGGGAAVVVGKLPTGARLLRALHAPARRRRRRRPAPGNLVALVVNAQVLNGFITPMLLTYILILANRQGRARHGRERTDLQGGGDALCGHGERPLLRRPRADRGQAGLNGTLARVRGMWADRPGRER